ncbi:MAG TPA: SMP-30/gluconolactonase/LRE family protein, partial [Blastocatellia bacterium]|nr:SMP-30/gluconolactonase/LRE family protein [Blastocatellia bacterium]
DTPLPTTSPKKGQLVATIPASFLATPGILTIAVEQDGIQSIDDFIVVAPDEGPFIFAISPSRIRIGEEKEALELTGANFMNEAKVLVDGQEVKTRNASRRRITAVITQDLLMTPGVHTIQVQDKDGLLSNVGSFEVVPDVEVSTFAGSKFGFNREVECVNIEEALFRRPRRLALAPDGLLYVTDQQNHVIRTINPDTGEVCTIAGSGLSGYTDTGDSPDFEPSLSYPNGIVVASDGTLYVTENGNNVVRRITRAGGEAMLETFAGINVMITDKDRREELNSTRVGRDGFRDGVATDAAFRLPDDIVVAPDGSLYLADPNNHAIRKITFNGGQAMVETIAGNGVPGFIDGAGEKARFDTPTGIALSLDGNFLYVADTRNNRIRRINLQTRRVETFAGSGDSGVVDGPAVTATFAGPIGLAIDADGVIYVSEYLGNRIRRIDPAGNVTTLAGNNKRRFRDGAGLQATFEQPRGLAIDRERGILYVADYENFRVRAIALR